MRFPWRAALGFALSAAFLYFALRGTHWSDVFAVLRTSNLLLWVLVVAVSFCTFPLRARRWRTILDPVAPDVPFGKLWRAVAIGMMVNNIVPPGRLGELARAFVLSREEPRVPFTTGIASLVVDRTFDALVVLALLVVALLDPAFSTETNIDDRSVGVSVAIAAAFVATAFLFLFYAVFAPARIEAIAAWFVRIVRPAWEVRTRELVRRFSEGLRVLRDPRRFAAVLLWTVAHWVVNAFAFWIAFEALAIDVPFTAALFVQGLIVVGVAAPSAPGFFGPFEYFGKLALGLYLINESQATAWAIGYHLLTFIPITIVGMYYVTRLGFSLGDFRSGKTTGPA